MRRALPDRRELQRDASGRRQSNRERQRKVDCPHCAHWDSLVEDCWPATDAHGHGCYVRRRYCQNPECRGVFLTEETLRQL